MRVICFGWGYLSHDQSEAESQTGNQSTAGLASGRRTGKGDEASSDGRHSAQRETAVPLDSEHARARMFEILSQKSRFARYRDICEFMPQITKENWRGVLDAYIRQFRTEGRTFNYPGGAFFSDGEMVMVLERIGFIAGQEALDSSGDPSQIHRSHMLAGWAEKDPKAAAAWLDQRSPDKKAGSTPSCSPARRGAIRPPGWRWSLPMTRTSEAPKCRFMCRR